VVVVGESLILLIGGMDLSLESTYGLAPMLAAWLIVPVASFGSGLLLNPYLGILILLAVGGAVGFVNGLLIVKGRLNGFIVTLGMTILLAGMQDGIVKGQSPFGLPGPFSYLGSANVGAIPVSLIVAALIFVGAGLSCAITGSAGPSTPSAGTGRRPGPPGSRWTGCGSACTWPAACWRRSAG
jgi:simple sugar transport system permease protein